MAYLANYKEGNVIKHVSYKMQLMGKRRKAALPGQKLNDSITQELQPLIVINPIGNF